MDIDAVLHVLSCGKSLFSAGRIGGVIPRMRRSLGGVPPLGREADNGEVSTEMSR